MSENTSMGCTFNFNVVQEIFTRNTHLNSKHFYSEQERAFSIIESKTTSKTSGLLTDNATGDGPAANPK